MKRVSILILVFCCVLLTGCTSKIKTVSNLIFDTITNQENMDNENNNIVILEPPKNEIISEDDVILGIVDAEAIAAEIAESMGYAVEYSEDYGEDTINLDSLSLSSDYSDRIQDVRVNEITRKIIKTVYTKFNDLDYDTLQKVSLVIENYIYDYGYNYMQGVFENEFYDLSSNVLYTDVEQNESSNSRKLDENIFISQSSNGTLEYRIYMNYTDLGINSAEIQNDWFVTSLTFTPAVSSSKVASMIVIGGYSNVTTADSLDMGSNNPIIPIDAITFGSDTENIKGTLGKSLTIDFVNSEGLITSSAQAVITEHPENTYAVLEFTDDNYDTISTYAKCDGYVRINLTGSYTKEICTENSTTEIRVSEIRLVLNENTVSYLLSSWSDVDDKTTKGILELNRDFLIRTSIN